MNAEKYVNKKINLTTLSPIFIGSDQASDLSPITDFVVEQDKIHIIDQRKFENLLSEDIKLIDEYVKLVKSRNFNLKSYIEDRLNLTVEELTKKTLTIQHYTGQGEIKSFITSSGNPFIPGSTVKGAIRTAVIFNFLTMSNYGKSKVRNLLSNAVNKFSELDKLKKIKRERKLNDKEYKTFKELTNKRYLEKNFSMFYNELHLFEDNNFGHDFRHIQISDSQLLELGNTKIIQLFREYLVKDNNKTKPWAQVLKEKTTTEFNFKIEKNFKDPFLQKINSNTYKEIFRMLNEFSLNVLDFELDMFNEFIDNGKQKIQEKLDGTINYYKDLKKNIEFSRDICAVIRIGGGKTYFDNSIGLALYKADKNKFKQFRKLLGFWKHRSNDQFVEEDSPITRTFYYDKNSYQYLPIGWTVIYFENDKNDVKKIFGLDKKNDEKETTQKEIKTDENDNEEIDFSKLENLGRVVKKNNR